MERSFLEFIKQIGIFIICLQSLLHFTAGKSYEKYIKLLAGIMILAQFVTPIRNIFLKGSEGELWEEIERFQEEMEKTVQNIVWDYEDEDEVNHVLEEEIKEKLKAAALEYGVIIDGVNVYGEPPKVEVTIRREGKEGGPIQVEKIRIGNREESVKETSAMRFDEMRKAFGLALHTDDAYIVIREE